MNAIEKVSQRFVGEILPLLKEEAELAYIISMVIMAVKSSDRQWHKQNLFFSYLKALLYSRGADVILALCTGNSPLDSLASNRTMLIVGVIWWLVLFVPFDIFNYILNIEAGEIKPILFAVNLLTLVRQVTAVDAAVASSLKTYPGSFIAIFVGTLAGNGSLIVSYVFGDFARAISNHKMTTIAFVTSFLITITKILCPKTISAAFVLTFSALVAIVLEILEAFDRQVDLFEPVYFVIRRVVVTRELLE